MRLAAYAQLPSQPAAQLCSSYDSRCLRQNEGLPRSMGRRFHASRLSASTSDSTSRYCTTTDSRRGYTHVADSDAGHP
eukprot:7020768-Pyramimonas_sp.AAC.1